MLCQAQQRDYRSDEVGQRHSSDLHQQTGGNSLSTIVPTSIDNLGVVCAAELGPDDGFCQSSMVPDSSLSEPNKETKGKGRDNHPSMGIATLVPNNPGIVRGLPKNLASRGGSSHTPNQSGLHNAPRSTRVSGMARIHKSFKSRWEALALILHPGDQKHSQTMTPFFEMVSLVFTEE